MKIVVIGGGIGGLALAQGLKNIGIDVAVYERDESVHVRRYGYRIGINPSYAVGGSKWRWRGCQGRFL